MSLVTVGHGTLSQQDFAALLEKAAVTGIVDVRAYPASRRHPHFGREGMAGWLRECDVSYRWEPRLGGRRRPVEESPHISLRDASFRAYADHMHSGEFRAALDQLLDEAQGATAAMMCAESVWWRCHRRLIADAAMLLRDVVALHLFHDGRLVPHVPMEAARVEQSAEPGRPPRIVYDVGAKLPLPTPGTA